MSTRYKRQQEREREAHKRAARRDREVNLLFHEAGHAVVAEILRPGSVRAIVIKPAGERGYCEEGHVETNIEVGTEARAIVCLAGAAAEALDNRAGKSGRIREFRQGLRMHTRANSSPRPSEDDERDVTAYLRKEWTGKAQREKIRRQLGQAAYQMVRENWGAVCDVAGAILGEFDRQNVAMGQSEIRLSRAAFLKAFNK